MQAYQAGVAALRLSLKDVTVERAESLVDQIQEVSIYFKAILSLFNWINTFFLTLMYLFSHLTSYVTLSMRSAKLYLVAWPVRVCHSVVYSIFN